tara:strand:+ start:157 stop:447 length:291 start_codon:yes stop_codon:yes gene_type:complete
MAKNKKVTYKELKDRIDFCFYKSAEIEQAVNYTHSLMLEFIDFTKNKEEFLKFLKEKKNEQERKSNTKGSGEDKSGDSTLNTKSQESGKSTSKRAS